MEDYDLLKMNQNTIMNLLEEGKGFKVDEIDNLRSTVAKLA